MTAMVWIFLPLLIAAGSALLAFYIMQAKLDVALAKEREVLAEARATIRSQEKLMEERVRAAEEASTRRAMEEFLGDIRVEERHYTRVRKSLFSKKKEIILQERLYFRNIPLSQWVEHGMLIEDHHPDLRGLTQRASIFSTTRIAQSRSVDEPQLLDESRDDAAI